MRSIKRVFILYTLLTFASQVFAAPKKQNKTEELKTKFDITTFNTSISNLPREYKGHDLIQLYNVLSAKKKQQEKNEFETTEQFNKRSEIDNNKPLYGELNYNSLFVYNPNKKQRTRIIKTLYDADSNRLTISIGCCNPGFRYHSIIGPTISEKSYSYIGSNAFGAKAKVTKHETNNIYLEPRNISPFSGDNIGSVSKGKLQYIIDNIPPEKAKQLKENIGVLIMFNLTQYLDSYIDNETKYYKPTIDDPYELVINASSIYIDLHQIWFYDVKSGTLLGKFNKFESEL